MTVARQIETELDRLEREEGIRVLYACESGSRAWGFESADSDYDVRFLYLHPVSWYLRVGSGPDTIERPIDGLLDISGWDLRKALHLLEKSNPPLLEWLQSPIVYRRTASVIQRVRDLAPTFYSPPACQHHYLHMAQGNYREYLQGPEVWRKKYFYVLRPVLACLWIERGYGIVPMRFAELVERTIEDSAVLQAIRDLIEQKKAGAELSHGPRIPVISDFLDTAVERLSATQTLLADRPDRRLLDETFRSSLIEIYGNDIRATDAP